MIQANFYFRNVEKTTDIIIDSYSRTDNYYSSSTLKHIDDSCKFSIMFDTAIANLLKQEVSTRDVVVQVKDGKENLFTGYVRKSVSFQKTQQNQPIAIEAVSPSYLLDKTLDNSLVFTNKSLREILENLLEKCGLSNIGDVIEKQIEFVKFSADSNIKNIIDELCFENSCVFDFDKDGKFYTAPLFNLPDVNTITQNLNGSNLLTTISISQKECEADYIEANWKKIKRYYSTLLFEDTENQTEKNKCEKIVDPKSWFLGEETNYLNLDSTYGEVLYVESLDTYRTKIEFEDGIEEKKRRIFNCNQIEYSAYNNSAEQKKFTRLDIYGTAWIELNEELKNVSSTGTKKKNIELSYLHTENEVKEFTENYANYLRYATFTLTVKTKENFPVGSFITVSDNGIGAYSGRIIQKQTSLKNNVITYKIETIDEFTPAVVSDTISNYTAKYGNAFIQDNSKDYNPPTVPQILSATSDTMGNIHLTWGKSTDESGIAYYSVYRRKSEAETYSKIAQIESEDIETFSYYDEISEKNIFYYYAVSATDKAQNQSNKSNPITVKSQVSVSPLPPEIISAEAYKDCVLLKWHTVYDVNPIYSATSYEVDFSKDGGITWTTYRISNDRFEYYFDRNIDGYPEIEQLQNWKFKIRSKSHYGNISENVLIDTLGFTNYTTWNIPSISFNGVAYKNNIVLNWKLAGNRFFGDVYFDIYLGENKIVENSTNNNFTYYFNGYFEKNEIEAMQFKVVAKTEAQTKEKEIENIDTDFYKTWIVEKPLISVVAEEKGLRIDWQKTNDFYADYPKYKIILNDNVIYTTVSETNYFYTFPELMFKSEIQEMTICVKIETEATEATSDFAVIDVSNYKDYIPEIPNVGSTASNRIISLKWDSQDVYGFTGCFIQVAKAYKIVNENYTLITNENQLEWFAPALGKNPYESLENYKNGNQNEKLEVKGNSITFSVPLFGQDDNAPKNTLYAYRLSAKTTKANSDWTNPIYIEATATTAQDIVNNAISEAKIVDGSVTANKIFVEELASISANLGYINDGALQGDRYNYWAVNDTILPDKSILYKGSFRVGGVNQYIQVTPKLENNLPTGEYDIDFVVGNYSVSATGSTTISGGDFTVYDTDNNLIFQTSPNGNKMAVETGTYQSTVSTLFRKFEVQDDQLMYRILGQYTWRNDVYLVTFLYSESKIVILKVDSKNEDITVVNSYSNVNWHYTCCPRDDEYGIVNIAISCNDGSYKLLTYNTSTNNFSVVGISSCNDLTKATAYGVCEFDDSQIEYYSSDGLHITFSSPFGILREDSANAIVCDTQTDIYLVCFYTIATTIFKLNKETQQVKYNGFYFVSRTVLDESYSSTTNSLFMYMPYYYKPIISDNALYFHSTGAWATSSTSFMDSLVSGIIKINLDNVVWYDVNDNVTTMIQPDFYEYTQNGETQGIIIFGFDKNSWFSPIYFENQDESKTMEYKFTVDYNASSVTTFSCNWHSNSINAEYITTLDFYIFYLLEYAIQASITVDGFSKVVLMTSMDYVNEINNYRISVYTFFDGEITNVTGIKAFNSGVGFTKVLYDEGSQHYKYYLDPDTGTPAQLEFDSNGSLIAVKGEKGDMGGTYSRSEILDMAHPVGTLWCTKNSALNPTDLFGGSWSKNEVTISFKKYYFWERTD